MDTDVTISEQIRQTLARHLKRDTTTIRPEHTLRHDLGLNSVDTFELLFDLEDTFDFDIADEDIQTLVTVSDLIAYVKGRVKEDSPRS